jgi:hypothetical protein
MTCQHERKTHPSTVRLKLSDTSQEFKGELTFTLCLECEYIEGTFSNGSVLNPKKVPITAPSYDEALLQCRVAYELWGKESEEVSLKEIHEVIFRWEDLVNTRVVSLHTALEQIEVLLQNFILLERAKKIPRT